MQPGLDSCVTHDLTAAPVLPARPGFGCLGAAVTFSMLTADCARHISQICVGEEVTSQRKCFASAFLAVAIEIVAMLLSARFSFSFFCGLLAGRVCSVLQFMVPAGGRKEATVVAAYIFGSRR